MERDVSLVLAAADRFHTLRSSQPGIVAVSGGADSVAMLRAFAEVGCERLVVGHFHHQLRGTESDGDEEFVRMLAVQLRLPFRSGRGDVSRIAHERNENLEATARELRYEWLGEVARETGANWIATAHTADDQAETVLHRIIRGTGIQGLRGIATSRNLQESERPSSGTCEIVRPFLDITRIAIEQYLAERQQPFREDSSNADLAFTRNRIRRELLPTLKTFNPEIVASLGRLAEQAEETTQFLRELARQRLAEIEHPRAGTRVILDSLPLMNDAPVFVREVMRLLWEREHWPTGGMTAEHWARVALIVANQLSAADFPGGIHVRRAGSVVQLGCRA